MQPRSKAAALPRREPEARRQAILEAGLEVFASLGFASAKLDDVAQRAGVAKGTIYLYFKDKQDLFEQIIREALAPVIAALQQTGATRHSSAEQIFTALFELFRREILETRRKEVLRLVIT
jgi:AcrR family transcriptional regulator